MAKKASFEKTTVARAKASAMKAEKATRKAKRDARTAAGIVKAQTKKGPFLRPLKMPF